MKTSTWFLAVGFILLWNSGFIGAEYALPYTDPLTLLFWRYLLLTFILFVYLVLRRRAVGDNEFVLETKNKLGAKDIGRKVDANNGIYELRESQTSYSSFLSGN